MNMRQQSGIVVGSCFEVGFWRGSRKSSLGRQRDYEVSMELIIVVVLEGYASGLKQILNAGWNSVAAAAGNGSCCWLLVAAGGGVDQVA